MESVGNIILYFIVAIAIIVFSVLTVTTRKILRSATYLLFVLFATAIIYFQMDYQFLGAVQIAVYAGGILVLFVFAIMLTQQPGKSAEALATHRRWLGLTAAIAGVAVCGYGLFSYAGYAGRLLSSGVDVNMEKIGQFLLSTDKYGYLLPFEAISVLLLACIIGGVRKNMIAIMISLELMLNSVDINFVVFNRYLFPGQMDGMFFSLFAIAIAAAETALALAIIINVFRIAKNVDINQITKLKF